jgi:hypothetical protein
MESESESESEITICDRMQIYSIDNENDPVNPLETY